MPIQQWSERIWVAQLGDEPTFTEDLMSLRDAATNNDRAPDIVLDLSGIVHINSSQITQLLRLRKAAVDCQTRLRLAAPTDAVWAVILTTGLDKVFDFSPDVSTALADLQLQG